MIAYYPMLKHLHMTLAMVSLLLFIYRWSLALAGSVLARAAPQLGLPGHGLFAVADWAPLGLCLGALACLAAATQAQRSPASARQPASARAAEHSPSMNPLPPVFWRWGQILPILNSQIHRAPARQASRLTCTLPVRCPTRTGQALAHTGPSTQRTTSVTSNATPKNHRPRANPTRANLTGLQANEQGVRQTQAGDSLVTYIANITHRTDELGHADRRWLRGAATLITTAVCC